MAPLTYANCLDDHQDLIEDGMEKTLANLTWNRWDIRTTFQSASEAGRGVLAKLKVRAIRLESATSLSLTGIQRPKSLHANAARKSVDVTRSNPAQNLSIRMQNFLGNPQNEVKPPPALILLLARLSDHFDTCWS